MSSFSRNLPFIWGRTPCQSGGNSLLGIKFQLLIQNSAFTIGASCLAQLYGIKYEKGSVPCALLMLCAEP